MKRNNKKGFTIVELTIVIAVIAILAAVLIPTFSSIVDKANTSSDIQLVRQANMILAALDVYDGEIDETIAKEELLANGIDISAKPANSDSEFRYLVGENRYVIFSNEQQKIIFPEEWADKGLVTLRVSETEQYYLLADSQNPVMKVPVPGSKNGKTFMGYFADGDKSSLASTAGPMGTSLRISFFNNTTWLKNANDYGRLFEASVILTSTTDGEPPAVFNDKAIQYITKSVKKQDDGRWKIDLQFYISREQLDPQGYNYDTKHRFLQYGNVKLDSGTYQIISVTLGGVRYYGADGTWTSLAQFENENITLYAHWE